MSSFTDPLIVRIEQRERSGRALFTLVERFTYFVEKKNSDQIVTIPDGFETDFASIPRIARLFISPVGLHAKAALVHDALYRGAALLNGYTGTRSMRRQCDDIFLEAMEVLKVPFARRWLMYLSVRAFGWYSYRNNHSTVAEQNPAGENLTVQRHPSVAAQAKQGFVPVRERMASGSVGRKQEKD